MITKHQRYLRLLSNIKTIKPKMKSNSRKPSHADSWYPNDPTTLKQALQSAMAATKPLSNPAIRGVIGPHAGYAYCSPTLAWSYTGIDPKRYKRVMLLGPSHYKPFKGCLVSSFDQYNTPLGPLPIDKDAAKSIQSMKGFAQMSPKDDLIEHSLEMHTPFIKHIFSDSDIKIVPIMVGFMDNSMHREFAESLKPYFEDRSTLWVISSDFCHWGLDFDYTPYNKADGPIYKSIEKLDRLGMDAIESNVPEKFETYIEETGNTICGSHPISIFMCGMQNTKHKLKTQFTHYEQSEQIVSSTQSSVSYAAGVTVEV